MKRFLILLSAMLLVIGATATASATYYNKCAGYDCIDFKDKDGTDYYFEKSFTNHTWTFDLDNDLLEYGDINPEDYIEWAQLGIDIDDESDRAEYADLWVDGSRKWNDYEVDDDYYRYWVSAQVRQDHLLDVSIIWEGGDFLVDKVWVEGCYIDKPASTPPHGAPVPEPATMLLLGSGLLGLAGASRKKLFKK